MSDDALLRFLSADGPRPEHAEQLESFGRLAGSWDLEMTALDPDGSSQNFTGEWHFGWVLEGRSVQDVLITRSAEGEVVGYGSTVRSFDARRGVWWVVWQDPLAGEFAVLLGRPDRDRMVLDGQWNIADDGRAFRWTFSNITAASFEWTSEVSDGDTWRLRERFMARRRGAEYP